jgi:hypothetical protein
MVVAGGDGGRPAERAYADSMTGDYLKAVAAALSALRTAGRRHGNESERGVGVTGRVAVVTGANTELAELGRASTPAGCQAGLPRWRAGM